MSCLYTFFNYLFWKKYLPYFDDSDDVYLICCFRKPAKVEESNKGKLTREAINEYNKRLINAIKRFCEL